MKRRFTEVSEDQLCHFREQHMAPKTVYATSSAESALKNFHTSLSTSSTSPDYFHLNESSMNSLLEKFFISCRPSNAEDYKSSSLQNLRQNLIRAIRITHQFDIVKDPIFKTSNTVFVNRLKDLKQKGLGVVDHFPDISKVDILNIVEKLSPEDPHGLQLLVWFLLQLHFCKRGQENAESTTKDHYSITEIEGKKCITQVRDELTKNHREMDRTRAHGAIMVEQDHPKCPVTLYSKYLSKLDPNSPFLWQLVRKKVNPAINECWYEKKAGKNTIANFMKKISKICNLSKTYTNHSVRATACTLLGSNHSDIDIQSISGHRSLSGLSHYKRVENNVKMKMSETFSRNYLPAGSPVRKSYNENDAIQHKISANSTECIDLDCSHSHNECCISFGATDTNNSMPPVEKTETIIQLESPSTVTPIQSTSHTDLMGLNIDDFLVKEIEQNHKNLQINSFFQHCTIQNVSINFNQKL
jgi:hypothetical protein